MRFLWKYLSKFKKEVALAPALKMLEALFDLFVPLLVAAIIDNGIEKSNMSYVLKMSLVLVLLAAVGLAISITAQYFAAKASVLFASDLRKRLFFRIQDLSYAKLDKTGTDTLMTRMSSDVNQVQSGLNLALRLLLRSPFIVFGSMIMAFFIDWETALIFAAAILVLSFIIFGIMRITSPLYKNVQKKLDKMLSRVRENLTGVRVIRAFRKEAQEEKLFYKENITYTDAQKKAGYFSSLLNPLTFVVINLATVFLIYTGALKVSSGALSKGSVVALYNYMAQILIELIKLANLIVSITKALASCDRIADILEEKDEPATLYTSAGGNKEGISFDNVSFTYENAGAPSLKNIDFTLKPGEDLGVIGGTGSGKTTFINLLQGLYTCSEGNISVSGTDPVDISSGERKRLFGLAPQKSVLFSGTVRSNMRILDENASDKEILSSLKTSMALDFVEEKGGLDAVVEQGGRNFSGGQRQRLSIARALTGKNRILILDDATSALDLRTEKLLREGLFKSKGHKTLISVSQRVSGVMGCQKILVLDNGRQAGFGSHEELMASCPVYRDIYYAQFPENEGLGRSEAFV